MNPARLLSDTPIFTRPPEVQEERSSRSTKPYRRGVQGLPSRNWGDKMQPELSEAALRELYHQGYFRQAFDAGTSLYGEYRNWPDPVLAARIAYHTGSPRTGTLLILTEGRRNPHNLALQLSFLRYQAYNQGAWSALHSLEAMEPLFVGESDLETRVRWHCLKADLLSSLRDFQGAYQAWEQAHDTNPDARPVINCQADIFLAEDRISEALEFLDRAFLNDPRDFEVVLSRAQALRTLGRESESVAFLEEQEQAFESSILTLQLASYRTMNKEFEKSLEILDRYAEQARTPDKYSDQWLEMQRFRCHYRLDSLDTAKVHLARCASPNHRKLLKNLEKSGPQDRRVSLAVQNIRQSHVTCGPATIAIVSGFWGIPADQAEIAEEICYDGTSILHHRRWAEERDWVVREFTVDWDISRTLIDRGLPFKLVTQEIDSSHIQVVSGYDERLGVLCLTDPSSPGETELIAEEAFKRWGFSGPRGLLMVPRAQANRLEGVALPDVLLYDHLYALSGYLEDDNRPRAEQSFGRLRETAPDHLVTLHAEFSLALYDSDHARGAEVNGKLLERFPDTHALIHRQQSFLSRLGQEKARSALLEESTIKPECPAPLLAVAASALFDYPSKWGQADRSLRQALRKSPTSADIHRLLGTLRWYQQRGEESLSLHRYAACLEDKEEAFSQGYFSTSVALGRSKEGLEFLRARYLRLAGKRSDAGLTLCSALEQLGEFEQAKTLLAELLERFPEDASLLLFAVDLYASLGEFEELEKLVEKCKEIGSESKFLRGEAKFHHYNGDPQKELECWLQIAKLEPSAYDIHSYVMECYHKLGQSELGLAYIEKLAADFPHNQILQRFLCRELSESKGGDPVSALQRFVEQAPQDPWGWRRLALELGSQGQEALERASELDSESSLHHQFLADWHRRCGEVEKAKVACRNALRIDVAESSPLFTTLIELCSDASEAKKELHFLWSLLEQKKDNLENALFLYQLEASQYLDQDELLDKLSSFNASRTPSATDLGAEINQARTANRTNVASALAEKAITLFPYHVGLRIQMADLHHDQDQQDEEIAALQKALALAPTSSSVMRRLSDIHRANGELAEAAHALRKAIAVEPGDSRNREKLAELCWMQDDKEQAVENLKLSLRLNPENSSAWSTLFHWAGSEPTVELARLFTKERPRDVRSWLHLYRSLPDHAVEECWAALDKALELAPLDEEIHTARIYQYLILGRFEEALKACSPEAYQGRPPRSLRLESCCVKHRMGRAAEALSDLKALLESETTFSTAWLQLADWSQGEEKLAAAQGLVKSEPKNPINHFTLGLALEATQQDPRPACREALRLDDLFERAALLLYSESVEKNDAEQLQQDFKAYSRAIGPNERAYYEYFCAFLANNETLAKQRLTALALSDSLDLALSYCIHELIRRERSDILIAVFEVLGQEGQGTWKAGSFYAQALLKQQKVSHLESVLKTLPKDCEFYYGFLGEYLGELTASQFKSFIKKHGDEVKSHTYPWGTALSKFTSDPPFDYATAINWSEDWKNRDGVQPWMLFHRSIALRSIGRGEEAYELDVWIDRNLEPDHFRPYLDTCLAFEEASAGQVESAAVRLQRVSDHESNYYRFIEYQTRAILFAEQGQIKEARQTASRAHVFLSSDKWDSWLITCQARATKSLQDRDRSIATHLWAVKQSLHRNRSTGIVLLSIIAALIVHLISLMST